MPYRIEYDGNTPKYKIRDKSRPVHFAAVFFLLFLLFVSCFWPAGKETFQRILFPGSRAITVNALETLADNLRTGTNFSHSIEAFCLEIISGGTVSD